ncbi:hypothetical protein [Persephonella sp.]|uniref:hypothetical protein n=1 Tax=Persephonella sp. TaxID=2060922 RepID=UPI0026325B15|nr:hypothetical protein [Persephonella sp.]
MRKVLFSLFLTLGLFGFSFAENKNVKITNEMIYQKLIDIDKRLTILETQFRDFKEETNKRFEQIDKRFEDINKRFEDINRRFEDINKRFDHFIQFLWIITGIFTTLTVFVIGFAYWDRRTIIKRAKDETLEELQKEEKLRELYQALKQLAKKDPELAKILKQFNIL